MKGKTVAIGVIVVVIVAVIAIILMVQATFKNNPTQKNQQSLGSEVYVGSGEFGWQ